MKNLMLFSMLFSALFLQAQDMYWTSYNFVVEPQNEAAVYQLVDDYFKENKKEGVTVRLFENHFNDSGNEYTHSIGFSGSLDAMGSQYAGGQNAAWDLFLTRLTQHIKAGFNSFMGQIITVDGDQATAYPIQRYYLIDVADDDTFLTARKKYTAGLSTEGMLVVLGTISSGHSPDGETHMVIQGFKDFKAAMGGVDAMLSKEQVDARHKAWKEFQATNGGVKLVRSGTRVLLGKW